MKTLFAIMLLFATQVNAQTSLKLTLGKRIVYDNYYGQWQSWPDQFNAFPSGQEPVLQINKLDDQGSDFSLRLYVNYQQYSFEVTFLRYDSENNWYIYEDANKDQICIVGSTMSQLAQYGWPGDNTVQIYFWVYSQDFALELE